MPTGSQQLTKQGVRDLGGNFPKKRREPPEQCEHKRLRSCCSNKFCGHIECPDCGMQIDSHAHLQGRWIW